MAMPAAEEPLEELPPAPRDEADDLLRSIEEQLSQFERRVRADVFTPDTAEDETVEAEADAEDVDWSGSRQDAEPAPEPRGWQEPRQQQPAPRSEYRFRGPAGPGWSQDAEAESAFEDFAEPRQRPAAPRPERAGLFARDLSEPDDADDDRVNYAEEARRRLGEPALRGTLSEPVAASGRASDFASLEAQLSKELDTGVYAGEAADEDDDIDTESDDDMRIASAAVIAPEHGMRPPPPQAAPPKRGFRPGLATIAGAVIVVALGAAGAVYLHSFDSGPSGPPPVIAAPDGPVKIEPAQSQADNSGDTVGEAVYDRVAGRGTDTAAEETVVNGAEEPQEIARIVPPPADGGSQMAPAEGSQESAAATAIGTATAETGTASSSTTTSAASGLSGLRFRHPDPVRHGRVRPAPRSDLCRARRRLHRFHLRDGHPAAAAGSERPADGVGADRGRGAEAGADRGDRPAACRGHAEFSF